MSGETNPASFINVPNDFDYIFLNTSGSSIGLGGLMILRLSLYVIITKCLSVYLISFWDVSLCCYEIMKPISLSKFAMRLSIL